MAWRGRIITGSQVRQIHAAEVRIA